MIPSVHSQHVEQGIKDFPRTITYTAPFDKCDGEQDYATDWVEFAQNCNARSATTLNESVHY